MGGIEELLHGMGPSVVMGFHREEWSLLRLDGEAVGCWRDWSRTSHAFGSLLDGRGDRRRMCAAASLVWTL